MKKVLRERLSEEVTQGQKLRIRQQSQLSNTNDATQTNSGTPHNNLCGQYYYYPILLRGKLKHRAVGIICS